MLAAQQRYRASGLNLVTAAIVLWNTVYLEPATTAMRDAGRLKEESMLQFLAFGVRTGRSTRCNFGRYERMKNLSVLFFPFSLFFPPAVRIVCTIHHSYPETIGKTVKERAFAKKKALAQALSFV